MSDDAGAGPTPSVEELLDHLTQANNELVTRLREVARRRAADAEDELLADEAARLDGSLRAHLQELLEAVRQVDAAAALPRQSSDPAAPSAPAAAGRHLSVVRPAAADGPVETGPPSSG